MKDGCEQDTVALGAGSKQQQWNGNLTSQCGVNYHLLDGFVRFEEIRQKCRRTAGAGIQIAPVEFVENTKGVDSDELDSHGGSERIEISFDETCFAFFKR